MPEYIKVGRISSPYGIKGWVKVQSFTEPALNLFDYQPWHIKEQGGKHRGDQFGTIELQEYKSHGKGYVAKIREIPDRNAAEAFGTQDIYVAQDELPGLEDGEFYWHQLQNCRVESDYEGECFQLGVVKTLLPTGANDVLVVAATADSIDDRERLIPYVPDLYIKQIDTENQLIKVEWDPEF